MHLSYLIRGKYFKIKRYSKLEKTKELLLKVALSYSFRLGKSNFPTRSNLISLHVGYNKRHGVLIKQTQKIAIPSHTYSKTMVGTILLPQL